MQTKSIPQANNALEEEGMIIVSRDQISRYLRDVKNDSLISFVEETSQILSLLSHMREVDPGGVYISQKLCRQTLLNGVLAI